MPRQVVYWDTDAFLGLLNKDTEPDKCTLCEDVWVACEHGTMNIVTSTLTIAEVIYKKGTPKLDESKRPLVNNFFRVSHIIQKPLTRAIAELARDIVWDFNIKPKDAIHVATAVYYKIGTMHTFDEGLLNQKAITINDFTIVIGKPHAKRQLEIPSVQIFESVQFPETDSKMISMGNIALPGETSPVSEQKVEKDKEDTQEVPE